MEGFTGLALAVSLGALAVSLGALTRGAPARLRDEAETAVRVARDAIDRCDRVEGSWNATKAEYGSILDAIEGERENIQRHRARLSAAQSRETNAAPKAPQSREELLLDLRESAGLLNTGG